MKWGLNMFDFISQSPMPTTTAMEVLNALIFAGGSVAHAIVARPAAAQPATAYDPAKNDQSFSFFNRHQVFKALPDEFADAYREMFSFKALKDGWDGIGSESVNNASVDAALAFLNLLPTNAPAPDASASADGTVDWYWRSGDHSGIVTFHKNGKVAYFVRSGGKVAKDTFELSNAIPADLIAGLQRI